MGCSFMARSSSCNCSTTTVEKIREVKVEVPKTVIKEVPFGNPNPKNFRIQRSQAVGKHLVVEIFYPDCKNYEGRKILLYDNMRLERLAQEKTLDPHFCDNKTCVSPIARFEPSNFGWELAIKCCKFMDKEPVY